MKLLQVPSMLNPPTGVAYGQRRVLVILLALFLLVFSTASYSHFNPFAVRVIHAVENDDHVELYMKIPLPLVLLPNDWKGIDSGEELAFVLVQSLENKWRYLIDRPALTENWKGFAEHIMKDYEFRVAGSNSFDYQVEEMDINSVHDGSGFSTLATSKAAFNGINEVNFPIDGEIFEASVYLKLVFNRARLSDGLTIRSRAGEGLPMLDSLYNAVIFHTDGGAVSRNTLGFLDASLESDSGKFGKIVRTAKSGIVHILMGWDHVVFILLLVLSSSQFRVVFTRATAFTLGHCITLSLGVLGYIPEGEWFIPFVELAIALSLVYGAAAILLGREALFNSRKILCIGLIHGFGFSFVLKDILSLNQSIDFVSLIGFNLGIELGQMFIYLAALFLAFVFARFNFDGVIVERKTYALPCIAIATYWVVERGVMTAQVLFA